MQTKPSIGIWADGSSFGKVIPTLQAEGYEVVAAQHSLDVIQDEATREESRSKAPMFGTRFPIYPDRTSLA
jgi:hypothetical protein